MKRRLKSQLSVYLLVAISLLEKFVIPGHCLQWNSKSRRPNFGTFLGGNNSPNLSPSGSSLVIVIPAYNEEDRLPETLRSYTSYLEELDIPCEIEILVVDDGSLDRTPAIATQISERIPINCISLSQNQGKGAALAKGIQFVKARYCNDSCSNPDVLILTLDADGSGELRYVSEMLELLGFLLATTQHRGSLEGRLALVTGNRNYDIFSLRGILRGGFQTTVWLLTGGSLRVQDSQCGYKLMTLPTADLLYRDLNLQGWSHDVEVLYRASAFDIPIGQVSMDWKDKDGSKVIESGVVNVSLQMLFDVIYLRWSYLTGDWGLPQTKRNVKET